MTPHRIAAALAIAAALPAAAQEARPQLLSYEALPSAQVSLDLSSATYAQREAAAEAALDEIAPRIAEAAGFDPATIETEVTPGGYLLKTNASLQARLTVSDADATRLAASLGYVFRQWSVLVSELDEPGGGTAYVTVAFPDDALSAETAQAFFEHAASVHSGLGGGYTAFGDEMIFLNVRDGEGAPYSGLGDLSFAALLGAAAGSFGDPAPSIAAAGEAEARFVGNDWSASEAGEDYVATLDDPDLVEALDALRLDHTALVERMGAEFGWR